MLICFGFTKPLELFKKRVQYCVMYGIIINEQIDDSHYTQIYTQLKNKIVSGDILSKTKLLSTRVMSKDLNVSRSIILEVIDQLKAEGYLETIHGSGTYVIDNLVLKKDYENFKTDTSIPVNIEKPLISFVAGLPNLSLFPRRVWNKCYTSAIENAKDKEFSYPTIQGKLELRDQIVSYLYRSKGIKTTNQNIFITSGASQALGILSRVNRHSKVVLEDPLADFVYDIFVNNSCDIDLWDVDNQGIIHTNKSLKGVDFLYLSPSHQFPLGGTLPANRRIEIIKKAQISGTYIIEDDYDGEYRYNSRPISPLHTLAPETVIYVGTFSKTLSPALRLGYMVVPDRLIPRVLKVKSSWDCFTESLSQMAMVRFIQNGDMDRHIRKSFKYYKSLRLQIIEAIKDKFSDSCIISGESTGLHLILEFPGKVFNKDFKKQMKMKGLYLEPLSRYNINTISHTDKIIFGYGQVNIEQVKQGLDILYQYIGK